MFAEKVSYWLYYPYTVILLVKLIWKEPEAKIIKRETVFAISPTGQEGTKGHLVNRAIKHNSISTKSPADYVNEDDTEGTLFSEKRLDIKLKVCLSNCQQPSEEIILLFRTYMMLISTMGPT